MTRLKTSGSVEGFTLLETVFGIAIIIMIFSVLTMAFLSFRSSSQLSETHSQIVSILRDARSRTMASVGNTAYGVHFEESKAVLFQGGIYDALSPTNETYLLPASLIISSISLGGPQDVVFQRLNGFASASGTVTVSLRSDSLKASIVDIFATGNVR